MQSYEIVDGKYKFLIKNAHKSLNDRFNEGLNILRKYDPNTEVNDMGDGEYYVGNMNIWENTITQDDYESLEDLGFTLHESAECMLFNASEKI